VASKVLQEFDLSQCPLGENFLAEDIGYLLDGDSFTGLAVGGSARIGSTAVLEKGIVPYQTIP
jgi:hypothetical protein